MNQDLNLFITIKKFMLDGGTFMWVILITWLFGLSLSFFKMVRLKIYSVNPVKLFNSIKSHILENNVDEAIRICSNTSAILPVILRSALKRANEDRILIEDAVSSMVLEQAPKVNDKLSYISLTANISTLLGLLGTIQGLIMSFAGVANADPGMKSKILAMGISKAMNTTAFGLISAITLMVISTILANKAMKLNNSIDEYTSKLVDLLSIKQKKANKND